MRLNFSEAKNKIKWRKRRRSCLELGPNSRALRYFTAGESHTRILYPATLRRSDTRHMILFMAYALTVRDIASFMPSSWVRQRQDSLHLNPGKGATCPREGCKLPKTKHESRCPCQSTPLYFHFVENQLLLLISLSSFVPMDGRWSDKITYMPFKRIHFYGTK